MISVLSCKERERKEREGEREREREGDGESELAEDPEEREGFVPWRISSIVRLVSVLREGTNETKHRRNQIRSSLKWREREGGGRRRFPSSCLSTSNTHRNLPITDSPSSSSEAQLCNRRRRESREDRARRRRSRLFRERTEPALPSFSQLSTSALSSIPA
ncbi:hypothetical protein BDY24DRAFT_200598 [Mrakia frigida]|uniref:uncharacterized protein n=1 Tax=Mrakia frigida TaxID=29902 RepID=UPI003FCC1676